jgi:hypothetical protein
VKVTKKLAHEIQNRLQLVIGFLELALTKTNSKGAIAVDIRKAKAAALDLAELVKHQTVKTVDNCEECGAVTFRAILEPKREKQ